jgi:chaperonin GroES
LDVSVGDQVIFGKYAGSEIKLGDRKLLIMQESDLYAIVEE